MPPGSETVATSPAPLAPEPNRRWASLEQAAKHLECSERTIRRLIASGRIAGYRFGDRLLRVDLAEVDALAHPIPTATAVDRAAAGGHR